MRNLLVWLVMFIGLTTYGQNCSTFMVESKSVAANCYDGDGKVLLTKVQGGSGYGTYTYLWSNGYTQQNLTAKAGNYTCVVTDKNGCVKTINETISQPNKIELISTVDGGDGSAKIINEVTGGVGPYTYTYFHLGTKKKLTLPLAIPNLNNLSAGYYRTRVVDSKGCSMETVGWVEVKDVDVTKQSVYLKQYPNPANVYSIFEYKVPVNRVSVLKFVFLSPAAIIYQTTLDPNENKLEVLTVSFPNGTYSVTVEVNGKVKAHTKVIVQH